MEIDGKASPLLYVSSKQINFLVLPGTDLGTADVLVRSSAFSTQFKGTMQVRNVAPALFSKDATGTGPGAILNAVTFTGEPFLVETPQNSGDDKRTRLAAFATGLRFAGNPSRNPDEENVAIQVQARDSSGNSYDVEYAGSAPGFFGLDQINLILPAEADNAGVISLAIAAGDTLSNTVTFKVGSLPDNQVHLSDLVLSPTSIIAGSDVNGTVSLNARARFGGYNVSLANNVLGRFYASFANCSARTDLGEVHGPHQFYRQEHCNNHGLCGRFLRKPERADLSHQHAASDQPDAQRERDSGRIEIIGYFGAQRFHWSRRSDYSAHQQRSHGGGAAFHGQLGIRSIVRVFRHRDEERDVPGFGDDHSGLRQFHGFGDANGEPGSRHHSHARYSGRR